MNIHKTKNNNKNMINKCRYFVESNFVGVNRLIVLVYSKQIDNSKRYINRSYYLPKFIYLK